MHDFKITSAPTLHIPKKNVIWLLKVHNTCIYSNKLKKHVAIYAAQAHLDSEMFDFLFLSKCQFCALSKWKSLVAWVYAGFMHFKYQNNWVCCKFGEPQMPQTCVFCQQKHFCSQKVSDSLIGEANFQIPLKCISPWYNLAVLCLHKLFASAL